MTPEAVDKLLEDLKRRKVESTKEKMIREIKQIQEKLSPENLLRMAYVPFVIARLVWDYADTIVNLCSMMKLTPTKGLCRTVRQLRREYDQDRMPFIDKAHEDCEEDNMIVYEEQVKAMMNLYLINLECAIKREFKEISREMRDLLKAVYQCDVLVKALFLYTDRQMKMASDMLGWRMGSMLPDTIHRLKPLIPEFLGEMALDQEWIDTENQYVKVFANQIGMVEFTKIK